MKKILLIALVLLVGALAVRVFQKTPADPGPEPEREVQNDYFLEEPAPLPDAFLEADFVEPLPDSGERITKKPFGKYVEPENSPVSPERFTGYHTAIDLEAFPEELGRDVEVKAVCDGELLAKRNAQGYGGVAVQSCLLEGRPITVVYGHLALKSISASPGQNLAAGDTLGLLGEDKTPDTDGERKHLHLGFHKGEEQNILGYVGQESQLSDWIDPCQYVCR